MLRRAGLTIHPICEVYPNEAHKFISDPEWIKLCGENNWVIVSGDKRLETVPENRQAIIDARVKVFLLTDSNSFPEVWAAAVIIGRYKMQEIIDANPGPFFVNISKRSDKHIDRLRLPFGFSRPAMQQPDAAEAAAEPAETATPEPMKQVPAEASESNPDRDLFSQLS